MIKYDPKDKALVLATLYNASKPLGMGMFHYTPQPMTEAEAEELIQKCSYFDYLKGRVMKLNLATSGEFDERLYDRDNGDGAAYAALEAAGLSVLKI